MFLPIPPTTPKASNPINVQLRKSPRLHPTPTVPMKTKKLLFGHLAEVVSKVEAEVRVEPQLTAKDVIKDWTTVTDSGVAFEDLVDNEVEDGGASEDDETARKTKVRVLERINGNYEARYCSPYYHVNAFRATYAGFIFPFDNEEDWGKVQPENHVDPPPLERHPGHNRRTYPLGKGEGRKSKKSKQSTEDNEANEVEPQNVDNNEGEPQVENVDNNESEPQEVVNDIPRATRGGRAGGTTETTNVQTENPIRYSTRGDAGRGGGRGLGWWLGEYSQPPSTLGQSTPCPVFSKSLTHSQPK
ncbi:hypothetical protein IFM89_020596 [Coptis chinensis]|uniref:Uncharacterized protein n=1 Tax=Coptis chinensis TaxID=261450 RepID=A0A835M379_9MAGN|nr:hypothetical protein IFM89_020596 [Coptis chinensis]